MTSRELFDFYNESKKIQNFEDGGYHIGPYDFTKQIYGLGEAYFEPPKKTTLPFFKKEELKIKYEDYDFKVVKKEFLAYIIETYTKKIQAYYTDMMEPFYKKIHEESNFIESVKKDYGSSKDSYTFDFSKITNEEQTALYKVIQHVRSFSWEWREGMLPYDLEKGNEVSTSWKYEYAIFELVRIYKTFDWKRNVMVFYGY